jgi:membrane protein YqaA with SNARE-associated domain
MSTVERRMAARANQRAAAFIRFQMLGDHEAMHFVLSDAGEDETARLAFVTALASIAGSVATTALGREPALAYLQSVAENSAALSAADDIDSFFDD